jgi:aspartyl-tRNA(Asn)/glutamyl-tRNA(Gln) amidotransferase subunit C
MSISVKDVEHVAWLARLGLTEEEKKRFASQLGDILEYAQRVSEADTSGVEPMAHAVELKNVMRADDPADSLTQEEALSAAPMAEAGGFAVPRIV